MRYKGVCRCTVHSTAQCTVHSAQCTVHSAQHSTVHSAQHSAQECRCQVWKVIRPHRWLRCTVGSQFIYTQNTEHRTQNTHMCVLRCNKCKRWSGLTGNSGAQFIYTQDKDMWVLQCNKCEWWSGLRWPRVGSLFIYTCKKDVYTECRKVWKVIRS